MTITRVAAAAALAALLAGCAARAPERPSGPGASLGIEVTGVTLMAGGDLAKLTYRVTDYETAKKAMNAPAALYPEGGGRPLTVVQAGRLGPLRQRPSATGKPQFMLFTNGARALRRGGTATLRVGETLIEGIPVS